MKYAGIIATGLWVMWSLSLGTGLWIELLTKVKSMPDWVEMLWRSLGRVHQELWLLVPPGVLIGTVHDWHDRKLWLVFFDALSMWNWWHFRNWPEDNHWKRRGNKAKESVAVRAGRLVVVPAGESA